MRLHVYAKKKKEGIFSVNVLLSTQTVSTAGNKYNWARARRTNHSNT